MIDYFDIKNELSKKDSIIMLKSKKYERDIKNIKFSFDNFSSVKLRLLNNIELSKMKMIDLKNILNKLKRDNIYDYESDNHYYKIFTSIYEKKEEIDFLMSKINNNNDDLKDQSNKRITINQIEDTIECLNQFKIIIQLDNKEMPNYIKNLTDDKINKFISYSKIYKTIIELGRNEEN